MQQIIPLSLEIRGGIRGIWAGILLVRYGPLIQLAFLLVSRGVFVPNQTRQHDESS